MKPRRSAGRAWARATLGAAAVLGAAFTAPTATAHPVHVSLAEAHHRPARHTLELSVRVSPEDMQQALRVSYDPSLRLDVVHREDPRRLTRLLAGYARARIGLSDPAGTALPPCLVGYELDARWMWLHLVFPVGEAADLREFKLDQRSFFEIAPSQRNTVVLHHAGGPVTLTFQAGSPASPIAAPGDPTGR